MRPSILDRVLLSLFVITLAAIPARPCGCAGGVHGKSAWEIAKLETEGSTAIFEGTISHVDLKWKLLEAKDGEFVPGEVSGEKGPPIPQMAVTFRVVRAYKGNLASGVTVHTGLGGGDCGARFSPGLIYLVYLFESNPHEFWVSLCSPGGWIGENTVVPNLRFLRNEQPLKSDLAPMKPAWMVKESPKQQEQARRRREGIRKQHEAATGQICGIVRQPASADDYIGTLAFLSTSGYSPVEYPYANVRQDGSYCSDRLGPGSYYALFTKTSDHGVISETYYPGVNERTKARPIDVVAGQTKSNVDFDAKSPERHSVRGMISTDDKTGLSNVYIALFPLDGRPRAFWYTTTVDLEGRFPLPKTKFFKFDNVLPGRYVAWVSGVGTNWFIRKVEVDVTTPTKFFSLDLSNRK